MAAAISFLKFQLGNCGNRSAFFAHPCGGEVSRGFFSQRVRSTCSPPPKVAETTPTSCSCKGGVRYAAEHTKSPLMRTKERNTHTKRKAQSQSDDCPDILNFTDLSVHSVVVNTMPSDMVTLNIYELHGGSGKCGGPGSCLCGHGKGMPLLVSIQTKRIAILLIIPVYKDASSKKQANNLHRVIYPMPHT